jgi:hypothetical protein
MGANVFSRPQTKRDVARIFSQVKGSPLDSVRTVTDTPGFPDTEEVIGSNPVWPTPFFENPSSDISQLEPATYGFVSSLLVRALHVTVHTGTLSWLACSTANLPTCRGSHSNAVDVTEGKSVCSLLIAPPILSGEPFRAVSSCGRWSGIKGSADPDQAVNADQFGVVVHSKDDEPGVAKLGHTLARVFPSRQAEEPVVRVIADPCQCPDEQVEHVVGKAGHLAEDGLLQMRPVGHAPRRNRM